jgi:hypothetical protein
MKVSVERPAPAGLPTVAIDKQIILFVTQHSQCTVRQVTSPAVASINAPSTIQCRCDSPNTFRILMERNCVLCDVGSSMLCALYTDVSSSHEAVPTLTLKFQTLTDNAALQIQHATQPVRTPAVCIPPPRYRSAFTRKKRALFTNLQRSKSSPVCACHYRHCSAFLLVFKE